MTAIAPKVCKKMSDKNLQFWEHSHAFGQEKKRPGESRTLLVITLTAAMMVVEIIAGILFGSMALLADGLHMASHAAALAINVLAYVYARRHANDPRYSFGTGKINALGGFAGAVLLVIFAVMMAGESVKRLISPIEIVFNQAILVAVVGLLVNGVSVFLLGHGDSHESHSDEETGDHHHHDHNLRSAYLHVLADALTSLLAVFALLTAKYFGWIWMDALMGIVGAILVSRWSLGLLRATNSVLLDKQGPDEIRAKIKESIEKEKDTRVAELHLWAVGPNIYSTIISIVAGDPKQPDDYKRMIPSGLGVVHVTMEVHQTGFSNGKMA